jgi:magnesium transporter
MSKRRGKARRRRRHAAPGTPPGTLTVDPAAPRPIIRVMAYGPGGLLEREVRAVDELRGILAAWPVTWVNVDGLGEAEVIGRLGEMFQLHRLALEDVLSLHQRAKLDTYGDTAYVVLRMATLGEAVETEQFSLFLGRNFVLTFQERPGDCLDPVRVRIREGRKRLRGSGPDYLAYALIDAVVDSYFPLLESYGERLDALQDEVIGQPTRHTVARIHDARNDLLTLRRAIWPLRDVVSSLLREGTPHVADDTRIYLRDCHDHTVQVIEILENFRDIVSSLMDVYLSSVGHRMNEIMKVLTIFAALFIPLTFITGLYGMNFNPDASRWNMPELNWWLGYPFALTIMLSVAVAMLVYFWRKGWL